MSREPKLAFTEHRLDGSHVRLTAAGRRYVARAHACSEIICRSDPADKDAAEARRWLSWMLAKYGTEPKAPEKPGGEKPF